MLRARMKSCCVWLLQMVDDLSRVSAVARSPTDKPVIVQGQADEIIITCSQTAYFGEMTVSRNRLDKAGFHQMAFQSLAN